MSFEELNVPKNHVYLFKPHLNFKNFLRPLGRIFDIIMAFRGGNPLEP